jgi:hypothetical protein
MIDIETLGLEPGAAILSIGAAEFGMNKNHDTFYRTISRESCEDAGLEVDEETLEWWQEQDEHAQRTLHNGGDLTESIEDFAEFVDGADEVWANSPSFDCRILIAAGKAVGVPMTWEFYEERDFRTLKKLPVAADVEHDGVEHNALDDAVHQARVAEKTLKRLEAAAVEVSQG